MRSRRIVGLLNVAVMGVWLGLALGSRQPQWLDLLIMFTLASAILSTVVLDR